MELTIPTDDGEPIRFECADTWVSRWVCEPILQGKTYPHLDFVDDVQVVVDAGANCGAATVHFARHHPGAAVHAFEPATEPRGYLERNTAGLPNVTVHPVGLADRDEHVPLYHGVDDSITGSVLHRSVNRADSELIELRAAGPYLAGLGLERIDIMKLDVEGCEVPVLESIGSLIPTIKVLYVEYDSRRARRAIDDLLRDTHELYLAMMMALDQGECIYVRSDIAEGLDGDEEIRRIFSQG